MSAIEKDSIASTSTTAIEPKADTQIAEIIDAFPRPEMKQRFTRAVCGIVETRSSTTYDSFTRDFGEHFVPGYKRPSAVDFFRSTDLPEPV